jgi:hypothetical protein
MDVYVGDNSVFVHEHVHAIRYMSAIQARVAIGYATSLA